MNTKTYVLEMARAQLSLDYNCQLSDFDKKENTVAENKLIPGSRIYTNDKCFFKVVCFGGKAIISTSPKLIPWCQEKLANCDSEWIFEYPKLRVIDKKLHEFGQEIADIHHYYLPNPSVKEIKLMPDVKWYEQEDIVQFRDDDRFGEAFAFNDNNPDVLAVAALDGDQIMGMAGASADSETLWQIGIDVLPEYRSKGIGTNLILLLKNEILKRGKVPFYGTAISHIHSQNIAINAGFFPAWAEIYSKPMKF